MTDDFDDLLDDVSELEADIASPEADQKTSKPSKHNDNQLSRSQDNESLSVILETAKTAQDAATKSQEVAETNLKLAENLKAQERELNEANFNWRQSFRGAVNTLSKTKGQFVVMMAITLVTCMIAIGAMSFLFYSIQQKEQAMKGEILDLLQNEQALFNKDMNVKVDQITAMMEMVQYQVEQALIKNATQNTQTQNIEQTDGAISAQNNLQQAPLVNLAGEQTPVKNNNISEETTKMAQTQPSDQTPASNNKELKQAYSALQTNINEKLKHLENRLLSSVQSIESRQNAIITKLEKLHESQQTLLQTPTKVIEKTSKQSPSQATLNKEQTRQLKNIHWWVSQQDKAIKRIEKTLKQTQTQKPTDVSQRFNAIDSQMTKMRTQQNLIEAQLEKLQSNVKQLINKSNESYRYKASGARAVP